MHFVEETVMEGQPNTQRFWNGSGTEKKNEPF